MTVKIVVMSVTVITRALIKPSNLCQSSNNWETVNKSNYNYEEITNGLNMGNGWYHSAHNLVFPPPI